MNDTECTCCCLDCIEGKHCYGEVNDHGWCLFPDPEEDFESELFEMGEEDEDALMGWVGLMGSTQQ